VYSPGPGDFLLLATTSLGSTDLPFRIAGGNSSVYKLIELRNLI